MDTTTEPESRCYRCKRDVAEVEVFHRLPIAGYVVCFNCRDRDAKKHTLGERLDWEAALQPGDLVGARWTNNYSSWAAVVVVVRVNAQTVRVRLVEDIDDGARLVYAAGKELVIPRMTNTNWTKNNCVEPVEEDY